MFSDYTKAPRHELRRVIEWYRSVEIDARQNITRLESLLAERERYARYRDNINDIAARILDTHAGLAGQALVDAVALTLQKPHSYAAKVAAVIEAQAKKRAQRARNRELSALAARIPVSQLARDYGLTRQTVSRVVNRAKKRPLG